MRYILLFINWVLVSQLVFAQKESLDLVSYTPIKGWKKQRTNEYISFTTTDEAKGTFCSITLYASVESGSDSKANFDQSWKSTIKETLGGSEPAMENPAMENGWELQTGTGSFNASGLKGSAMLVTATSNGRMINLVALLNSEQYATQLSDFISSIELKKTPAATNTGKQTGSTSSIVGIWKDNILETSGYYNNIPQYTAGYFRKEYTFRSDGTYQFLQKSWSAYIKTIIFNYETGTWSVNGNQLTLTPKSGKSEEWNKAPSGRNTEWGTRIKSVNRSLKKTTYTFSIKYYEGSQSSSLDLYHNGATDRESAGDNSGKSSYSGAKESIIDLPPGFKVAAISKTNTIASDIGTSIAQPISAVQPGNSILAGKIWEGISYEKFSGGNGFKTGGYFTWQYRFNNDGTYRFIYVGASAYQNVNLLKYEKGRYSTNSNQLTITPDSGMNEEWSNNGSPIKISAMSDVQIRKIKQSWGKKLKSTKRKLETYRYQFRVEYMEGNKANAMLLTYNGHTEREGDGNQKYYFETPLSKSITLPAGY